MKNAVITVCAVILASAVLFILSGLILDTPRATVPGPDPWATWSSDGRTLLLSPDVPDTIAICLARPDAPPACTFVLELREARN